MNKHFRVFSFAIACALASIPASAMDYSSRKFNNGVEANYPVGSVIVNADCIFEDGKFIIKSLPSNLPELFTIRFTAPEDFTQGNTIVINGTEMPLRVPSMINASSAIFRAGAVFHIDIDMDRQVAFAWGSQGGGGGGVAPNLSSDEQFAGYYDQDGRKVYVRTYFLGQVIPNTTTTYPTNIENVYQIIKYEDFFRALSNGHTYRGIVSTTTSYLYATVTPRSVNIYTKHNNWGNFIATVTVYYTCTDR